MLGGRLPPLNDKEILKRYDRALQDYANKIISGFQNCLGNQRRSSQPFLNGLFHFYLFCSYLVDSNLFPNDEKYTSLKILYAKSPLALFGIYNCLQNGLVTEGAILLRSLFETYFNVKLILKNDIEERLKLFDEFRFVEQWNNLQANKKLLKNSKLSKDTFDKTFTPSLVKEIEEKYSLVKSNYHPNLSHHWAWKIFKNETKDQRNPSIAFIADKLDLGSDYVKVYGTLSIPVHNSASLLNMVSTRNVISLVPNFSPLIYHVGCLAIGYITSIIEDVVRYLGFGEPDEGSTYVSAYTLAVHKLCNNDDNG